MLVYCITIVESLESLDPLDPLELLDPLGKKLGKPLFTALLLGECLILGVLKELGPLIT